MYDILWWCSQRSNVPFFDESLDHSMYGWTTEGVQTIVEIPVARRRESSEIASYDPPLKKFAVKLGSDGNPFSTLQTLRMRFE